jgi:hypothetical protein
MIDAPQHDGDAADRWGERYMRAAHGIQSAIAFLMNRGPRFAGVEPKHLRVGIDTSKAEFGALAELLIRKGVITEGEYVEAMTTGLERELERYTEEARRETGLPNITFG